MGRSEYGIKIQSIENLERALKLVNDHNQPDRKDVGESLSICALLSHKTGYWLLLINFGGREETTWYFNRFNRLRFGRPRLKILYPFEKPKWWGKDDEEAVNLEGFDHNQIIENCRHLFENVDAE